MTSERTHQADSRQDLRITIPYQYSVFFTRNVFAGGNRCFADGCLEIADGGPLRCLFFVDAGVVRAHPGILERIGAYCERHGDVLSPAAAPSVLPGGETCKNSLDGVGRVIEAARRSRLCRHSLIAAVGGGAVLDVVGFAASLVHRGIRLIRVPTTVLSQNDSGVGVKNGVNWCGSKNFLGTFAPPVAVFNDADFLPTLHDRDWRSGISEAVKVALIRDADFLEWLLGRMAALRRRDRPAMETLVRRCARLHLSHIGETGDPFEFGSARPLDFGHWAAHQLESMTDHALTHGEAVSVGMVLDLFYAADLGWISQEDALRVRQGLEAAGLPTWHSALEWTGRDGRVRLFDGIEAFREHLGGELHVTLPCPVGRKREVTALDRKRLRRCIEQMKQGSFEGKQPECG